MSAQQTITAADLPGDWRRRARPRDKSRRSGVVRATPTSLTKQRLKSTGWDFEWVERVLPGRHITFDFLGAFDCLAWNAEGFAHAIQVTSTDHMSHRRKKIEANPRALGWCQTTGHEIEVWGWANKSGLWVLTVDHLDITDRTWRRWTP